MARDEAALVDRAHLRANLEELAQRIAEDPSFGQVAPRVEASLVRDVYAEAAFTQYGKSFTFAADESVGRGGQDRAPSPMRYFLSGIAFCQLVWYAKASAIVDIELGALDVVLETALDMRGEHRVGDHPPHPGHLTLDVLVSSAAADEQVLAMVDEGDARCPIINLVRRAIPVTERVRHNDRLLREELLDPQGPDEEARL